MICGKGENMERNGVGLVWYHIIIHYVVSVDSIPSTCQPPTRREQPHGTCGEERQPRAGRLSVMGVMLANNDGGIRPPTPYRPSAMISPIQTH